MGKERWGGPGGSQGETKFEKCTDIPLFYALLFKLFFCGFYWSIPKSIEKRSGLSCRGTQERPLQSRLLRSTRGTQVNPNQYISTTLQTMNWSPGPEAAVNQLQACVLLKFKTLVFSTDSGIGE